MNEKPHRLRRQRLSLTWLWVAVLAASIFPAKSTGQGGTRPAGAPHPRPAASSHSQEPGSVAPESPNFPPDMVKKQKKELLKQNFEKMKSEANELVELSKSLQTDLDKSNENVLSLKVVDRAEKIEKLAKKLKELARGY
jgi:hypothetical protein